MKHLIALAATVIMLIAGGAQAGMGDRLTVTPGQPFDATRTYWVDSHQDVTIRFTLDPSGKAHFHSRYSNGKKLDGDHFYAKVVLLDRFGQKVAESIAGVGLNGSGMGRTNVAFRDIGFVLPRGHYKDVAQVRFEAGHSDSRDDKAFWQNIRSIAETTFGSSDAGAVVYGAKSRLKDRTPLVFQ